VAHTGNSQLDIIAPFVFIFSNRMDPCLQSAKAKKPFLLVNIKSYLIQFFLHFWLSLVVVSINFKALICIFNSKLSKHYSYEWKDVHDMCLLTRKLRA
jgi:hypothetical protein